MKKAGNSYNFASELINLVFTPACNAAAEAEVIFHIP